MQHECKGNTKGHEASDVMSWCLREVTLRAADASIHVAMEQSLSSNRGITIILNNQSLSSNRDITVIPNDY